MCEVANPTVRETLSIYVCLGRLVPYYQLELRLELPNGLVVVRKSSSVEMKLLYRATIERASMYFDYWSISLFVKEIYRLCVCGRKLGTSTHVFT